MNASGQTRDFWCFISYRHADNQHPGRQWATCLHRTLETYEVPADLVGRANLQGEIIPARIYPVFRDEEELPADADLSRPIISALNHSRCLLVICSPRACESRFVADEIARFKAMGKSNRVIAAIIAGEPNASTDPAKQKLNLLECFPEPLRFEVEEDLTISARQAEPVAADFRIEETGEEGWVSSQAYRAHLRGLGLPASVIEERLKTHAKRMESMKLKIIAGVILVDLGELTKRDQVYQLDLARKRAKVLRRWLVAVALLTLLAVLSSIVAWRNETKVRWLNQVQARNLREASWSSFHQADRLLAEADRSGDETLVCQKTREALLHLARSIKFYEGNQVARERFAWEMGLRRASLARTAFLLPHKSAVGLAVFSRDGKKILTSDAADTITIWDAETHEITGTSLPGNRLWKPSAMEVIDELSPYAAFNPDSNQFLTVCMEKRVQLWDANTGGNLNSLAHPDFVRSAAYSADGKWILTTCDDNKARIWDVKTAGVVSTMPCDAVSPTTAFNGDGDKVISAIGSKVSVHEVTTGDNVLTIEHTTPITSTACSMRGEYIAASDDKNVLQIWQLPRGIPMASCLLKSPVRHLFFSPDGTRVVAVCKDQSAVLVDVPGGREIAVVRHDKQISHCSFSSDGKRFATSSWDKTAKIWEAVDGKAVATLPHGQWVNSVAFDPHGRNVITACADQSVSIWHLPNTSPGITLAHAKPVTQVSFSKDGRYLISASADHTAKIWNVPDGSLEKTLTAGNWLNQAIMSADGRLVATMDSEKAATLWDAASGKIVTRLATTDWTSDAAFHPNGESILTAHRDNSARIWNVSTGKMTHRLRHGFFDSSATINHVTYSSAGDAILTASDDHHVKLWSAGDGKIIKTLTHAKAVYHTEFSPDDRSILTCSADKSAVLWERSAGKKLHVFTHRDEVMQARFHPSGKSLVTVSADGDAILWNAGSGELLAVMPHPAAVTKAVFSPDGARLATVCTDRIARLWDVSSGEILATFRQEKNITSIAISPDGKVIAIAGDDHLVRLHDCGIPRLVSGSRSAYQVYETMANAATGRKIMPSGNMRQLSFDESAAVNDQVRSISAASSTEAVLWNRSN